MKILVCTDETQGARTNDFCFAQNEEIVRFGLSHHGEEIDDKCGCRRALFGVNTGKGTTTFKVVETNLNRSEFRRLIARSFLQTVKPKGDLITIDLVVECAELMADFIVVTAAFFEVGQILEKRGERFEVRAEVWDEILEEN